MENQTMLSTQEAVVGGTEGGPGAAAHGKSHPCPVGHEAIFQLAKRPFCPSATHPGPPRAA